MNTPGLSMSIFGISLKWIYNPLYTNLLSFIFFLVAGNVNDCHHGHQEADFAVDSAERGVGSTKPHSSGCDSAYCCKREYPPQDTGNFVGIFCETRKPIRGFIMKADMIAHEDTQ